jgi:16S rRNA (guanine966-N2)-methyltransferase
MRVIGGKFRRRTLRTLRGLALRPTSDRLRETLFDILGASVEGARWLDVYAGSGAVGIEALSRGAAEVIFIEKYRAATNVIRENLQSLNIDNEASIIAARADAGLKQLSARGFVAEFVFLDPPYALADEYRETLVFLDNSAVLDSTGVVIAEHSRRNPLPERFSRLARVRVVEQGDTALSFYRRSEFSPSVLLDATTATKGTDMMLNRRDTRAILPFLLSPLNVAPRLCSVCELALVQLASYCSHGAK